MTPDPIQWPDPPVGDLVEGEVDAVGRVGREIIRQVDLDRLAALIERRPASALLDELAGILRAFDASGPRLIAQRSGIVGRLLGRDLAAQARAREAYEQVRLRLELAERCAAEVVVHAGELDDAIAHVERQRARLSEIAARGRSALHAFDLHAIERPDAMERRLGHLAVTLSAWDVAVAHLRLVRQYAGLLLARYAHVRDVVAPRWRREMESASRGGAQGEDLLRDALASMLQATAPDAAVRPAARDLRI